MTLADILGRGVQLEWHEAVAVVRDVIDRCAGTAPGSIPEFHDVELLPAGGVELHGGVIVDGPVERLVQMLQTLISPEKPPVQFAELVREPPGSLQAFSIALAYFERPNRVTVLRDLYSRASGSSPLPEADELIASLRATTPPAEAATGEQPGQSGWRRRRLLYAAILVSVIGASTIALALVWREGAASSIAGASSTLTAKVSAGVTGVSDAVGNAVSSIAERAGMGSGTSELPPPPPVAVEDPAAQTPATASPSRGRGSARPDSPLLPRVPSESFDPPALRKDQVLPGRKPVEAPARVPLDVHVITASDPADAIVYSASSPGVTEPVGVRPHVPKDLPADVKPGDVARIEIVVRPDGTVGSVKLLGPPRLNDPMLLSAAKAWRFRPATKDGIPVPYRKTVLVAR